MQNGHKNNRRHAKCRRGRVPPSQRKHIASDVSPCFLQPARPLLLLSTLYAGRRPRTSKKDASTDESERKKKKTARDDAGRQETTRTDKKRRPILKQDSNKARVIRHMKWWTKNNFTIYIKGVFLVVDEYFALTLAYTAKNLFSSLDFQLLFSSQKC